MAEDPGARHGWVRRATAPRLHRRGVRALALVGVALVVVSLTGWWLATRVLDDDGFGDVVAQASQKQAVRDYIGDQASIRLALTSNFVSGARPVVSHAISEVIDTPAVTGAIREFATGAHAQIFRINNAHRAQLDASHATLTIRSTLQSIDPTLAGKLPPDVLNSAATISQSKAIDLAATASVWVRYLYVPVGLLGLAILVLAALWSRDRTHAVRFTGLTLMVAGAFPVGLGLATPLFASIAASDADPGRGQAVGAFIEVLLGRLVGAGWALILLGLLLVFAPGRDGGDLSARVARVRGRLGRARTDARWQLLGALALIGVAVSMLTKPLGLVRLVTVLAAVALLYTGIVLTLRAAGLLVPGVATVRMRKRQLGGVAAVMVMVLAATTAATAMVVAEATSPGRADTSADGCNGYLELCSQPLDQIVWPASHNAMSSAAYNFYNAEHALTISDQLHSGVKVLLLDVYYGYEENGIVRTNLAGGVTRSELTSDIGPDGLAELNRLGALTGAVDTSGKKQELYFCHDYCELGAIKASRVLKEIKNYLDRNLTDVLMLDFEDYVQPADLQKALEQAGLFDMLYQVPRTGPMPTLAQIVTPKTAADDQNPHRLIVTSERHADQVPWLEGTYQLMQETPYTFKSANQFTCAPNRGTSGNPLLLVNHWLRQGGLPNPVTAASTNSTATLTARMQQCITERRRLPNILAVDFTHVGDLISTVNRFNSAIAQVTGVAQSLADLARTSTTGTSVTDADRQEIVNSNRLAPITTADATKLLGGEAARLHHPDVRSALPGLVAAGR